ncbi:ACP S-malonyltransferase [Bacillus sp. RC252]|uniref:ACP S-malonyltransferase n=1 Tax=Bacillus sp. RC252 TaxID=3156289 RepID=UPI003834B9FB
MEHKHIIFMFSGQGSQYYQMGKPLYENVDTFRKWMNQLDRIVQDFLGISIVQLLYYENKPKNEMFDRLVYTHPAIFMVEYALAQVLITHGLTPDYVIGTSLGEYAAAAVSEAVGAEDILKCIIKQAQLIEAESPIGGMTTILHDTSLFDRTPIISKNSEMVAKNYKNHFVISGLLDSLQQIESYLNQHHILFQRIPVRYGFHSRWIDQVHPEFLKISKDIAITKPKVPIISCVDGQIVDHLSQGYLWSVIRKPILFQDAIKTLEKTTSGVYLDLGPSGTLSHFLKRNLQPESTSKGFPIMNVFHQDTQNLEKVLQGCKPVKKQISISKRRDYDRMLTYLFPGQGSQQKGMGGSLFDEFQEITDKASSILGYSIKELCLSNPNNLLHQTQYTQPALYTVNALSYLKAISDSGRKPDFVAGHSLGEFNALFASGLIDFDTGLKWVKKRGELMSQATGGGMAAVIGLTQEKIQNILIENGLTSIDIANLNSLTQNVISGLKTDIIKAQTVFESAGAFMYIPLNVSGAFHSRYMIEAKNKFEEYIQSFNMESFNIPVISNFTARPYSLSESKSNIVEQIVQPVRWMESIQYLMGMGVYDFTEIGPGSVLSKIIGKIKQEMPPLQLDVEREFRLWREKNTMKPIGEASHFGGREEQYINQIEVIHKTVDGVNKRNHSFQQSEQTSIEASGIDAPDRNRITAKSLGSSEFKEDYNLKYAYLAGGMYRGIASKELVIKMAKAGMMGFFGTGGLSLQEVEDVISYIHSHLADGQPYGMNMVHHLKNEELENQMVDLFLKRGIRHVEASAFLNVTPSLVRFHAKGLKRGSDGKVITFHKVIAKVSRPEVAEAFLSPAPEHMIQQLLNQNLITPEEAELTKEIPVADDICVEADSAGHTDGGVAYTLIPTMLRLRDEMMEKYPYHKRVRIGAAGGIGTPEAAMAAFMLGADFILTGSINQCTVEAGTSDKVKDLLQQMNIQDTEYAPAGDSFEMGSKVQVLKKGLFFPSRANKLYELYRRYNGLHEIDNQTLNQIQQKYFKRSIDEVYQEIKIYYPLQEITKAEQNTKHKMALVFKWYFGHSTRLALSGSEESKVDYQIHCGPALGAFNQWVKGTELENWRNRQADRIGVKLMDATAELINNRFHSWFGKNNLY